MNKVTIGLGMVILLIIGGAGCDSGELVTPLVPQTSSTVDVNPIVTSSPTEPIIAPISTSQTTTTKATTSKNVRNLSLKPLAEVKSPLVLTGEARSWYFEGSFPVELQDANGHVLATGIAQAESDWMASGFVPFRVELRFRIVTSTVGVLVLKKDNPSDLRKYDESIQLPLNLQPGIAEQRVINLYYYRTSNDIGDDGNQKCSTDGLVALTRTIPLTMSPLQDTLNLLINFRPHGYETEEGITSEFPLTGFSLLSATQKNGDFVVTFTQPSSSVNLTSCQKQILKYQIMATAKQFETVKTLELLPTNLFK